jgi:carboxymethylenebutenolidase
MGEYVKIDALGEDAVFPVYVAAPSGSARAAIIIIPEIFGVNAGIRQKCDHLAAAGYLAIAPDIFWRFAPGVELNPDVEAELQQAFGYFGQYDADDGVRDIEAVIHAVRSGLSGQAPVQKVGAVGYCLGSGPIKSTFAASKWQRYRSKMAAVGSHSACKGILFRDRSHFGVLRI